MMKLRIQILLLFNLLIGMLIYGQNGEELISNYNFQHHGLSEGKRPSCLTKYQLQSKVNKIDDSNDSILNHRNRIYVELLGGNLFYSLGYKRIIINRKHYDLSASIGISTNFMFRKAYFAFGFPVSINNRFKFLKFNGVDFGIDLGDFFNVWTIKNQEKYYTPQTIGNPPILLYPGFHLGWVFRWNKFSVSPRFYALFPWRKPLYPKRFKFMPFLGLIGEFYF